MPGAVVPRAPGVCPECKGGRSAPRSGPPLPVRSNVLYARSHHVLSGGSLRALDHVELDLLALGEGLEPLHLDRGVVYEAVLAPGLRRNKAKALRVVEPLHGSGRTHD